MNRVGSGALLLSLLLACNPHDEPGAGLSPSVDACAAPNPLEGLIVLQGHGTWSETRITQSDIYEVHRLWVEAKVANFRYHKRILVEFDVPYQDGSRHRFLAPLSYASTYADGFERWSTDALSFYPNRGSKNPLSGGVGIRLRAQHSDHLNQEVVSATPWQAVKGFGAYHPPEDDPWTPSLNSPVSQRAEDEASTQAYFAPFDDIGAVLLTEIHGVMEDYQRAPHQRHTIHAAVFNLSDPELIEALIEAHELGVEVRLITEASKLQPWRTWMSADDRLLDAGVPILAVDRPGRGAMHVKVGLFNGKSVSTGSANWQAGARYQNHENLMLSTETPLIESYASYFQALSGGPLIASHDTRVSFGPSEPLHIQMGALIDQATESLQIAMFTAKHFSYWDGHQQASLFQKLVDAVSRGVEVTLITDHGIAEASEYYGVISEDDPTDEWLEAHGINVILADNMMGRYASMHHKFVIIDRAMVITGAYNWYYDASFLNDEDLLILEAPSLVERYGQEFMDLRWRYGAKDHPLVDVEVEIVYPETQWGETLYLVGSLPQLGDWDPQHAIPLSSDHFPTWHTTLQLPAGVRFEWKLITQDSQGRRWWHAGENRQAQAPIGSGRIHLD